MNKAHWELFKFELRRFFAFKFGIVWILILTCVVIVVRTSISEAEAFSFFSYFCWFQLPYIAIIFTMNFWSEGLPYGTRRSKKNHGFFSIFTTLPITRREIFVLEVALFSFAISIFLLLGVFTLNWSFPHVIIRNFWWRLFSVLFALTGLFLLGGELSFVRFQDSRQDVGIKLWVGFYRLFVYSLTFVALVFLWFYLSRQMKGTPHWILQASLSFLLLFGISGLFYWRALKRFENLEIP